MKTILVLLSAFAVCLAPVWADSVETPLSTARDTEHTPLDIFQVESSFVFDSQLSDENRNIDFNDQNAFSFRAEYAHRFHISGHWYLRAGAAYDRFDFGGTNAPVPDQLHSIAGVISIDYMVGADRGAFLEIRPGFYAQDTFDGDSFDVPITLARAWVLQPDKLFLVTGANVAFLRGQYPILPFVGLMWRPNDQWTVNAILPEPRIIYSPNKQLDFWVGGELVGGSFRTNDSSTILPRRLSNAAVDYSEYRGGVGLVWHIGSAVDLDLGGGYTFQRRFNFERADEEYTADGAPYIRASLKAAF